jgi:hypothetical protein
MVTKSNAAFSATEMLIADAPLVKMQLGKPLPKAKKRNE